MGEKLTSVTISLTINLGKSATEEEQAYARQSLLIAVQNMAQEMRDAGLDPSVRINTNVRVNLDDSSTAGGAGTRITVN